MSDAKIGTRVRVTLYIPFVYCKTTLPLPKLNPGSAFLHYKGAMKTNGDGTMNADSEVRFRFQISSKFCSVTMP